MTRTPHTDPFEDRIREALSQEAAGPAPDRLVARIAATRRDVRPGSSFVARIRARVAPRQARSMRLGFGLAAVAVVVVAGGLLVRGLGPDRTPVGPGASGVIASPGTPATSPASPAPSTAVAASSPASSPRPSSSAVPIQGPVGGPIPADFQPVSVTFVSAGEGWLLGSATCSGAPCAAIVRTSDGGRTWAGIPAPGAAIAPGGLGQGGISGLRFADPLDGWAFGPDLWATHDGGATWQRETLPGAGPRAQVTALEAGAGAVHAAFFGNAGGVQIASSPTHTGAWTVSSTQVQGGAGPVPHTQIVLQGTSGWLLQVDRAVVGGARLAGGTWRAWQPPCLTDAGPATLAAASVSDLVAACDVGLWATPTGVHLYTSSDGGATFTGGAARWPVGDVQGVAAAPAQPTVVVAGSLSNAGGSGLVASFDLGKTWTVVYAPKGAGSFSELGFTTPQQGVAITTAGSMSNLVMTRDGGHTWAPVPVVGP